MFKIKVEAKILLLLLFCMKTSNLITFLNIRIERSMRKITKFRIRGTCIIHHDYSSILGCEIRACMKACGSDRKIAKRESSLAPPWQREAAPAPFSDSRRKRRHTQCDEKKGGPSPALMRDRGVARGNPDISRAWPIIAQNAPVRHPRIGDFMRWSWYCNIN